MLIVIKGNIGGNNISAVNYYRCNSMKRVHSQHLLSCFLGFFFFEADAPKNKYSPGANVFGNTYPSPFTECISDT